MSHGGTYLKVFCTKRPATTAMVVGRDAAHTPSLFNVFSSIPDVTTIWRGTLLGCGRKRNEWGGEREGEEVQKEKDTLVLQTLYKKRLVQQYQVWWFVIVKSLCNLST